MKIAIVGSREYPRLDLVHQFVATLPADTVIVSGGARGVDTAAENAAKANKLDRIIIRPNWEKYGKSAGFKRNVTIVEESDWVVAFWDGESRGTQHSIGIAKDLHLPLTIYGPDGDIQNE